MTKIRLALAAALILIPLTAQAHDHEEIQEWEWNWEARVEKVYQDIQETDVLTSSAIERLAVLNFERQDFESRHPCHFTGDCSPTTTAAIASATGEVSQAAAGEIWMDSVEEWRPLVAGHFAPGDVETALCLMERESAGNPTAKNPSGASGLMQVMPGWANDFGMSVNDLMIPEKNLYAAARIKDIQGWTAWSPYNRGECRGL